MLGGGAWTQEWWLLRVVLSFHPRHGFGLQNPSGRGDIWRPQYVLLERWLFATGAGEATGGQSEGYRSAGALRLTWAEVLCPPHGAETTYVEPWSRPPVLTSLLPPDSLCLQAPCSGGLAGFGSGEPQQCPGHSHTQPLFLITPIRLV